MYCELQSVKNLFEPPSLCCHVSNALVSFFVVDKKTSRWRRWKNSPCECHLVCLRIIFLGGTRTIPSKKNTPKIRNGTNSTNMQRYFFRTATTKYRQNTLGTGNLQEAVVLPKGEDLNEWLATNSMCSFDFDSSPTAIDFYNKISLIYAKVMEFCTSTSCPIMSGIWIWQLMSTDTHLAGQK